MLYNLKKIDKQNIFEVENLSLFFLSKVIFYFKHPSNNNKTLKIQQKIVN